MESLKWKYHYLYKTINLVNGTYYIGMHSTNDLNDGYMGSGQHLRRSIKKHGRQNFRVEILEWFDDRNSLSDREREVVNETLINDPQCMNHELGGCGGFHSDTQRINFILVGTSCVLANGHRGIAKQQWLLKNNLEWRQSRIIAQQETYKRNGSINGWSGKSHDILTKQKISTTKLGTQTGEKNSQFGTCWITNGTENKKIKRTELASYETAEWKLGRI